MKTLRTAAVLGLALLAACSDGGDACAGKTGVAGTRQITITSGGRERTFRLDAPESALGSGPVPLVLVYHGVFSTGPEIQANTGFPGKAAAEGFITAAGDGVGRSWNAGVCCQPAQGENVDDVGFTRDSAQLAPTASCTIAPDCTDGATTELCSVSDLGHRWPGGATNPEGPFRATDAVWDFLAGFSS